MTNKVLLTIMVLFSILALSNSKVVRKTWTLRNFQSEQKWNYITQFTLDLGRGYVNMRARLFNLAPDAKDALGANYVYINFNTVYDDMWSKYESSNICEDVNNYAFARDALMVRANGEWSDFTARYFHQEVKNHIWYFTANDCENNLRKQFNAQDNWKIQIEVTIHNTDDSHFSYDQQGFLIPYVLLYLGSFVFLLTKAKQLYENYQKEEELDYPFLLGIASLMFQNGSFLLEIIHLFAYKLDGEGILFFHVLSQIASICSQFTITVFLVLVSWGWTLTYKKLNKCEYYIPFILLVAILHIVMVGLGNVDNDEINKFHIYDGISGNLTLFLRIAMFVYYIIGIKDTEKKASDKVKEFIKQFTLFGGLYFLSFPILVFISNFCDQYIRNQIIIIGGLLVQTISIQTIIYINSNKNSIYYKASQQSHCLLPNGKED